jgi:hypothetical protein
MAEDKNFEGLEGIDLSSLGGGFVDKSASDLARGRYEVRGEDPEVDADLDITDLFLGMRQSVPFSSLLEELNHEHSQVVDLARELSLETGAVLATIRMDLKRYIQEGYSCALDLYPEREDEMKVDERVAEVVDESLLIADAADDIDRDLSRLNEVQDPTLRVKVSAFIKTHGRSWD